MPASSGENDAGSTSSSPLTTQNRISFTLPWRRAVARLPRRDGARRVTAALAIAWGSFVSPYAYDYDLTMLSVSAALIAPLLVERAGVQVAANLLAALVAGQFAGLTWWTVGGRGGVVFFVVAPTVLVAVWFVLRREAAGALVAGLCRKGAAGTG